jgi:hypothetical protein
MVHFSGGTCAAATGDLPPSAQTSVPNACHPDDAPFRARTDITLENRDFIDLCQFIKPAIWYALEKPSQYPHCGASVKFANVSNRRFIKTVSIKRKDGFHQFLIKRLSSAITVISVCA